ncbi:4-oxalomesaconate tautomerase [Roseomonas sp. F4]
MHGIPCVMMRGGTSRGPFFHAKDLPADPAARDRLLVGLMGSGHELEIDGIGGGSPLTSKVAIISPSKLPGVDVDYLFAQVHIMNRTVDTGPNCGNMLAAVGPFAIEQGLVPAKPGETLIRIHNVNTGKIIEAAIQTPGGAVTYAGTTRIDGVPGTAAPVKLAFLDGAGSKTGALFPSGNRAELIKGVRVTCIDMSMPMVLIPAEAMGKTGHEGAAELDADTALMARMEAIRQEAGRRMGFGDVTGKVVPKIGLVARPAREGTIAARYFVPWSCHKSFATTGSVCVATASVLEGTVAHDVAATAPLSPSGEKLATLEHPSGSISVALELEGPAEAPVSRAGVLRTARRLFAGTVYAPDEVAAIAVAPQELVEA